MLGAFLVTLIGVAAAQASPGPNFAAVVSASLTHGRRAGFATTAGVASGMLVWATGFAFGLGVMLEAFPLALTAMKLVGGAYLLWMAAKAMVSAWRGTAATVGNAAAPRTLAGAWRTGLFVVLTNPKAALMWAAVATLLFGTGLDAWQVAAFGPVGAASGLLIYGTYAWLFSTRTAGNFYRRFARGAQVVLGAVFGAFGAGLIIDGARELRA